MKDLILKILIIALISSCESNPVTENSSTYCGIQTDEIELDLAIENPYDFTNASEAYDAINDTIRERMPNSLVFEVFLAAMSNEAIAIYIYAPKNEEYIETIGCAIMNADFPSFVPEQRYMLYYSYLDDPNAALPLEVSIKRK